MSFSLLTTSVSHEAALAYRRFVGKFGVTLKVAEAAADLIIRLANALPDTSTTEGVSDQNLISYVDKEDYPWRMRFTINKERSEVVACRLLDEKIASLVIPPHAWFRFLQRLSIANNHPSQKEAMKEMIRSLLRGVWWVEAPKGGHPETFHCVDLRCRWGPFVFKLVDARRASQTGSKKKILVTCHPQKGKENDNRRKKRDRDERPMRKRDMQIQLRRYLSGETESSE